MKELISEKRVDYMNYLNRQLLKNDETVRLERAALDKLQAALQSIQDKFRADLEAQQALILAKEEAEKKAIEEAKKKEAEAATDSDKPTDATQEEEPKEESKDDPVGGKS